MSQTVTYYFSLVSPWAFLGHAAFMDVAKRHGADVEYRPVFLGEVFPATGGLPLAQRAPARQKYRFVELQRWREKRGIALNLRPKFWPLDIKPADQLVIAICEAGLDPDAFIRAAFSASWCEERNIADDTVLADLLHQVNLDAGILAALKRDHIGLAYRANAEKAIAQDVFGSPSYVLNGEVFWGQDRLDLLESALASNRPAYLPNA